MASFGWNIVRVTPIQANRGFFAQRTRSRNLAAWVSSWTARASAGVGVRATSAATAGTQESVSRLGGVSQRIAS
jgi:hypothetical protein